MVFYRKSYFPLESNPEVFTTLSRKIGVGTSLVFRDVISLDVLPHPTLALILAFPTSNMYEIQRELKDFSYQDHWCCGDDEDVTWFIQTINNACGLYALLHAVCNGNAKDFIGKTGLLLTGHISHEADRSLRARLATSKTFEVVHPFIAARSCRCS